MKMNLFKISQLLDVVIPDYPAYPNTYDVIGYAIVGAVVVAVIVGVVILLKNKKEKTK
jgi:hypothetical protein